MAVAGPLWGLRVLSLHPRGPGFCGPGDLGVKQRRKCFHFPATENWKTDPTQPTQGPEITWLRRQLSAHQEGAGCTGSACGCQCGVLPTPTFRVDIRFINCLAFQEPSAGKKAIA